MSWSTCAIPEPCPPWRGSGVGSGSVADVIQPEPGQAVTEEEQRARGSGGASGQRQQGEGGSFEHGGGLPLRLP